MGSNMIGEDIGISALPIKIVGIIFHDRGKMMLFTLMRVRNEIGLDWFEKIVNYGSGY